MDVLSELYGGLPRQSPGSESITLSALGRLDGLPDKPEILDVGCGTGAQSIALATNTGGNVTAIDILQPFLDTLDKRAAELGLEGRIRTLNRSMSELNFSEGSFDLIWSEGAVYFMGVSKALSQWHGFLRPGGAIAFTELSWLTDYPPHEAADFWQGVYPGIRTADEVVELIRKNGYEHIDSFTLPEDAWWDEYYIPLLERLRELEKVEPNDPGLQMLIEENEVEIEMYRKYSKSYGYVFHIARKPDDPACRK